MRRAYPCINSLSKLHRTLTYRDCVMLAMYRMEETDGVDDTAIAVPRIGPLRQALMALAMASPETLLDLGHVPRDESGSHEQGSQADKEALEKVRACAGRPCKHARCPMHAFNQAHCIHVRGSVHAPMLTCIHPCMRFISSL